METIDTSNFDYSPGRHDGISIGGTPISYTIPAGGINSETTVMYHIGSDAYINNNTNANVILINGANTDWSVTGIGSGINDLINGAFAEYGLESPGLQNHAGWSLASKLALSSATEYIEQNPDCPPQVVYSLDWGSSMGYGEGYNNYNIDEDPSKLNQINILAQNGGTLVLVEPRSTSNDYLNRLTQIQINNGQGEVTQGFYIPTNAVKIRNQTDLKMVICSYKSGPDDHLTGGKALSDYIAPSVGNKQDLNNSNEYIWYILEKKEFNGEEQNVLTEISFSEYLDYAYSYTPTTAKNNTTSNNSSDVISIEYSFVNSYMNNVFEAVKNSNITKVSNIATSSDGSATFAAANKAFNSYSNMTVNFLTCIGTTYNSVLKIADSMYNLDSELASDASSLDGLLSQIEKQDLSFAYNFFSDSSLVPATAFDLSDSAGNIKISKEGLLAAISNNNIIMSTLFQDIADTNSINQAIQSFVNDSPQNLQGEAWDRIRIKFSKYSQICDQKVTYADNLINGLTASYQKLLTYLEDYDELDTSKIPEVEKNIQDIEAQITSLENQYDALAAEHGKTYEVCDEKGNVISSYTIDNSAQMQAVSALIETCTKIKTELNRNLEKLNGLADADQAAANDITEAEAEGKQDVEDVETASNEIPPASTTEIPDETPTEVPPVATPPVSNPSTETPPTSAPITPTQEEETPNEPASVEESPSNENGGSSENSAYPSPSSEQPNEVPAQEATAPEDYFATYEDIYSDETKLVYNINDECKLIIHHNGDTPIGIEYYYDFGSKDNAVNMLESIATKYSTMEGYNGVILNDRFLKVTFTEDIFKNQSLDYFKEMFQSFPEVTK